MKKALAILCIIGLAVRPGVGMGTYPTAGHVVSVGDDVALIETTTGYQYWIPGEDWYIGDIAVCIMYDNGTKPLEDDRVIVSKYSGY